jgi:hypothetical protein
VDQGIVAIVNRALDSRTELLSWHVANSLDRRFPLPATLGPLETALVDVASATLEIQEDSIDLTVELDMSVSRAPPPRTAGQGESAFANPTR